MKKHKYLNKSQKLLLATMTIPLAASVLPAAENVSASEILQLKVYDLNGSPKLEWATEILQENILIRDDFDGNTMFVLNENLSHKYLNKNIQNFDYINKYSGLSSLNLTGTTNERGNHYDNQKYTSAEESRIMTNSKLLGIPDNSNLSISIRVKNIDKAKFNLQIWDNQTDYGIPTNVNLKEEAIVGNDYIYVDKPEELNLGEYILVSIPANKGEFAVAYIKEIDLVTGKLSLSDTVKQTLPSNHSLKIHQNPVSADFEKIIDTNSDWTLINLNAKFGNQYHSADRGNRLQFVYSSESDIYIDELVIGYATEVEVFKEGTSIYKGFLADFHDTGSTDNEKPNKVKSVNALVDDNFNIKFNLLKPEDKGSFYKYQIQAISKSNIRSELSEEKEVEIKSEVKKYKYTINQEETGTPTILTTSLDDLKVSLKEVNLETDYIHVQAIDGNGNESDVTSYKIKDIFDMSSLQDLYEKIKELEDSGNVEDFIDFVDELEGLYGDNLPQDLKDRLNDLSNKHGLNTSFLLLEEGDFLLTTSEITDFGKVKLTAKKQTVMSNFLNDFGVIDARGTQEGWNVSVSATPFTVETFDGFIGTPHKLPVGSMSLNAINTVEQIGTVHNSQLPDITLNQLTAIDGQNATINLLNAEKQKGMGEFQFTFGSDALALTVDAVTAKIDTVNYPDKNTPYASTVTWDLVSGPQL